MHGRVAGLILAAGASTRLGFPKQLVIHDGDPLVKRAARAACDAGLSPVIVVLGAQADRIAAAVSSVDGVRTIVNHEWETGLASSLAAGLREISRDASSEGALVVLADQPFVDASALGKLLDHFDDQHPLIASEYEGTIGVPAVFARRYFSELMSLTGDSGAGQWLRKRSAEVLRVPLQTAKHDIDTLADVSQLDTGRNATS